MEVIMIDKYIIKLVYFDALTSEMLKVVQSLNQVLLFLYSLSTIELCSMLIQFHLALNWRQKLLFASIHQSKRYVRLTC